MKKCYMKEILNVAIIIQVNFIYMNKQIIQIAFALVLIILLPFATSATSTQFKGAHITYKCLGGEEYEIILQKFFNPCNTNLSPGQSAEYFFKNSCTNTTDTLSMQRVEQQTLGLMGDFCTGFFEQNIYTYKDTVQLDSNSCCSYDLGYTRSGARDMFSSNEDLYIESSKNICIKPCHDGIEFNSPVSFVLHDDEKHYLNFGGIPDPDENVSYHFDSAWYAPGTPYNYSSGNTYDAPFDFYPTIAPSIPFDTLTGTMEFTPLGGGFSDRPIVIRADKRENGQFYSTTRQEIMFDATTSNNSNPELSGFDSFPEYSTFYCENIQECKTIYTYDADGDSVFIDYETNLPSSAGISIQQDKEQKLEICWQPDNTEIADAPYELVISAWDDGNLKGQTQRRYIIDINAQEHPEITFSQSETCNEVTHSAIISNASKNYDFAWVVNDTDTVSNTTFVEIEYPEAGEHTIEFKGKSKDGCDFFEETDTVEILHSKLNADAGDNTTVCENSPKTLIGEGKDGKAPYQFSWDDGPDSSAYSVPTDNPGSTDYALSVTDDRGCTAHDTTSVTVRPLPNFTLNDDMEICSDTSAIELESTLNGDWTGTGVTNGTFDPSVTGTGTFYPVFEANNQYGCTKKDSIEIIVNDPPEVDAGNNPGVLCHFDTLALEGTPSGGTWDGAGVNENNGDYTFIAGDAGEGNFTLFYEYIDDNGCSASDFIMVEVIDGSYNLPDDTTLCYHGDPVTFTPTPSIDGEWSGPGIDEHGEFDPQSAGEGVHELVFDNTASDCIQSKSIEVTVEKAPEFDMPADTIVCYNAGEVEFTTDPEIDGEWIGLGINESGTFDPQAVGEGVYSISFDNSEKQCFNMGSFILAVEKAPEFDMPADTTVCYSEETIPLSPIPATDGQWSGPGITQLGIFDPSEAGAGTHELTFDDPDKTCFNAGNMQLTVETTDISISIDPDTGQVPVEVTFVGGSAHEMDEWHWEIMSDEDTFLLEGQETSMTFEEQHTGLYNVKLSAFSDTECGGEAVFSNLLIQSANFIAAEKANKNWQLYPNPAEEGFTLEGEQGNIQNIELYTISGQKISSFSDFEGNHAYIPRNDAPAGQYLLLITLQNGEKFLMQGQFH